MLCVCADITISQLNLWIKAAGLDIDHRRTSRFTQAEKAQYFQDCPNAAFYNVETQEMLNAKVTLEKVRLV